MTWYNKNAGICCDVFMPLLHEHSVYHTVVGTVATTYRCVTVCLLGVPEAPAPGTNLLQSSVHAISYCGYTEELFLMKLSTTVITVITVQVSFKQKWSF